jgi:hypothetical protein
MRRKASISSEVEGEFTGELGRAGVTLPAKFVSIPYGIATAAPVPVPALAPVVVLPPASAPAGAIVVVMPSPGFCAGALAMVGWLPCFYGLLGPSFVRKKKRGGEQIGVDHSAELFVCVRAWGGEVPCAWWCE